MNYDYLSSTTKVTVPSWKDSKTEKNTVYFVIELSNRENKWSLEKRFSEFDALIKGLKNSYHSIPALPTKTFIFKMTDK